MRRLAVLILVLVLPSIASAQPITLTDGFAPLVAKVAPAVVSIMTDTDSAGSGVIITSDGLVVTNHHVVAGAENVVVAFDEKRILRATRLGSDRENDLALLRLPPGTYPSIAWADSAKVRVGEFALAIGNPLNVGKSVSIGIVSAVGRGRGESDRPMDFIQTDAAINKGNSGGALVNARGELIGINSRILTSPQGQEGIAFAIAANLARGVVEQILKIGSTKRGWIGVIVGIDMRGNSGIADIVRRGPADRAGLRINDIFLEINRHRISDVDSALAALAKVKPGEKVPVLVNRDGAKVNVMVTVAERPASYDD